MQARATWKPNHFTQYLSFVVVLPLLVTGCRDQPSPDREPDSGTDFGSDCIPQCENRACGPDGCGQLCGSCPVNEICQTVPDTGALVCAQPDACLPNCANKTCGPDGCNGSCGECGPQHHCDLSGRCVPCVPSCTTECGPDGCGSFCGTCDSDKLCGPAWKCVAVGAPCDDLAEVGQCSNQTLTFCHEKALTSLNCSDFGLQCSYSAKTNGFDCVESPCVPRCSGRICGDNGCHGSCGQCPPGVLCTPDGDCPIAECTEDLVGRCEENVLVTCSAGQQTSIDCGKLGLSCRYDPDGNDGLGAFDCK